MELGSRTRVATLLLVVATLSAAAQQPPPEPWHLRGSVGFNFSNTDSSLLNPLPGFETNSDQTTAAGDVRLILNGFLKDPRLLLFNLDFNGQRGGSSIGTGSFDSTLLNWGVNTLFLPQRPYPLRFYYRRSDFGTRGDSFGQNTDNSALGLDWSLRLPDVPRLTLSFTRSTNDIRIPTSLSDVSYRQRTLNLGIDDQWKGWQWQFGFQDTSSDTSSIASVSLSGDLEQDAQVVDFRLRRSLWGRKADLDVGTHTQWRDSLFPDGGATSSTDTLTRANFRVHHTPKLSSNYYYSNVRVRLESDAALGTLPGLLGDLLSIGPTTTFVSHNAGSGVSYQLTESLRLFEDVRYSRLTPPRDDFESRRSLTESFSGVAFQDVWHGVEFGGTYTGHYQLLGTNFGNDADTFSNDFEGRLGWGTPRLVRLRGTALYSKLSLVEQLGGFSDQQRARVEAVTDRLYLVRLRLSAERSHIELLNLSGDTQRRATTLNLNLDHSRFSLGLSRTLSDGAGAVFPGEIRSRFLIAVDLPLGELIATPLLDRTTRSTAANLVLRLNRNLDLRADWRLEDNRFATSDLNFRRAELRARYRIGRISLDFGFGKFRTEVNTAQGFSGTDINRIYFRVARDFRVF